MKQKDTITIIEQVHRSLPQKKTPEQLAKWIKENQKEVKTHVRKIPLTPEEVADFEHKSSLSSRALDRLKQVEDEFKNILKKGTKIDPKDATQFLPYDITIPPTKGTDALKANRQFADDMVERGYNEETTEMYMIPHPEDSQMVAVTIEGYECPDYSRAMTEDESAAYGKIFREENGQMRRLDNAEVAVNGNGTAQIKPKKTKREPII